MSEKKPWTLSMPKAQFSFMRDVLAAPSPVGYEGAMTYGVLAPYFKAHCPADWELHAFAGNAGVVLDSHPGRDDMFTVMLIGHADKIRMQVRSISDDGKVWINSDSFLPGVLLGHEVLLFSQDPDSSMTWRILDGGTVEALGAIHFADADTRAGTKGINPNMLYLDLQIHGDDRKAQVEALGIKPGDPIILHRPIRRGFSPDTFYGAYLDNGLGCFVTAETARIIAERGGLKHVRVLYTIASHEEIGRLGSRVAAGVHAPDVIIAIDVNHDFEAAPGVGERRLTPLKMGKGFTLSSGSITSAHLNTLIQTTAKDKGIPLQVGVVGRDTGTDAMAGVFASIDAAATSIGFPIRNMHTISETGHTGDVLASVWALVHTLERMEKEKITVEDFKASHVRFDKVEAIGWKPAPKTDKK